MLIGLFSFIRCIPKPWTFGKSWGLCYVLEGPPSIFDIPRFLEEALKLLNNFLIMLPMFYKRII